MGFFLKTFALKFSNEDDSFLTQLRDTTEDYLTKENKDKKIV